MDFGSLISIYKQTMAVTDQSHRLSMGIQEDQGLARFRWARFRREGGDRSESVSGLCLIWVSLSFSVLAV